MRGVRSLLLLTLALGGLLAYIYFVDAKKPVTPEGVEAKDKVFTVESDKIEEIAITTAAGESTTVKKGKDGWEVVQPFQARADDTEVTGITSNLAGVENQGVVDEAPSDLRQYGLGDARIEVTFKAAGDKAPRKLLIGNKTPTGGDMYAQRGGEKSVFLIPSYLDTTFDKKPFDLRDKTILKFDRDKVDRLELAWDKTRIELAKTGGEWRVAAPVQAAADSSAVEGLITRVQSAQMKSVVADQATDLKQYGLDAPTAAVTLGAGSSRASLAVGKAAEGGDLFARDVTRPLVVTVGKDLSDDLRKTLADLRRKDVFEFRPYNATRIEIARGAETFVFEKKKGPEKDAVEKWRRVTPSAAEVDQGKVDTLLSGFSNLRAQTFAESKPAGAPEVTVTVKFDDGKKVETVRFVRDGQDALAVRDGEPGAARLEASAYSSALAALDALK